MRHLCIPLLSLIIGLSSCAVVTRADEAHLNEQEAVKLFVDVGEQVDKPQTSEEMQMKKTIESYVKGADEQVVELVENAFHDDFQVFAHSEGSIQVIDKNTYLELLKAKKIGGSTRQIEYLDLSVDDLVGTARVNLVGEDVTFHDHLSLIKEEGNWKIVSNITYVSPNQ